MCIAIWTVLFVNIFMCLWIVHLVPIIEEIQVLPFIEQYKDYVNYPTLINILYPIWNKNYLKICFFLKWLASIIMVDPFRTNILVIYSILWLSLCWTRDIRHQHLTSLGNDLRCSSGSLSVLSHMIGRLYVMSLAKSLSVFLSYLCAYLGVGHYNLRLLAKPIFEI